MVGSRTNATVSFTAPDVGVAGVTYFIQQLQEDGDTEVGVPIQVTATGLGTPSAPFVAVVPALAPARARYAVQARGGGNASPWSAASSPYKVVGVPEAPLIVGLTADAATTSVAITFEPSDITGERYVALMRLAGSATPVEVPLTVTTIGTNLRAVVAAAGPPVLAPGQYTVQVAAYNVNGDRGVSSPASSVFRLGGAAGLPGAPTSVTATSPIATRAFVKFAAPADDGGEDITQYLVRALIDGVEQKNQTFTVNTTALPLSGGVYTATVTALAGGTYTFTVAAINAVGRGPASAASAPVIVRDVQALEQLAKPVILSVRGSAGAGATLAFTRPSNVNATVVVKYYLSVYDNAEDKQLLRDLEFAPTSGAGTVADPHVARPALPAEIARSGGVFTFAITAVRQPDRSIIDTSVSDIVGPATLGTPPVPLGVTIASIIPGVEIGSNTTIKFSVTYPQTVTIVPGVVKAAPMAWTLTGGTTAASKPFELALGLK